MRMCFKCKIHSGLQGFSITTSENVKNLIRYFYIANMLKRYFIYIRLNNINYVWPVVLNG